MIQLQGVSKAYRLKGIRKEVLREIDLHIAEGTNLALLGPNGAGKSTLMRIIAGTEQPDRGRVTRRVRLSWPLGFSGGFNGTMTGIENIRFVARIYGADVAKVIAFVEEFSELGPSLSLPIRTYSNGMKARLAFGMSMAIEFDVYLIDEITAVGDEAFKRKSKQVFETRLKSANIIMISHSAVQIREYCNAAVVLRDGELLGCEDVESGLRQSRSWA